MRFLWGIIFLCCMTGYGGTLNDGNSKYEVTFKAQMFGASPNPLNEFDKSFEYVKDFISGSFVTLMIIIFVIGAGYAMATGSSSLPKTMLTVIFGTIVVIFPWIFVEIIDFDQNVFNVQGAVFE